MTVPERLQRDYRAAFLRYLPRRDEVALHTGYELGRAAVHDRVSILDLAQVHHDLGEFARGHWDRSCPPDEVVGIATGGSEFFLEVLAPLRHGSAQLARQAVKAGGEGGGEGGPPGLGDPVPRTEAPRPGHREALSLRADPAGAHAAATSGVPQPEPANCQRRRVERRHGRASTTAEWPLAASRRQSR